jgi:hypothetical protein
VSLLDFLFPVALGDAEIRVVSPPGQTLSVSFIVKTLAMTKKNEYSSVNIPGLSGQPLLFIRGGSRTLSVVFFFDGRATDMDVRQPMKRVAELMRVDPATHAPPVLSFEWRGESLQCVLESAVEEFRSLFPDGRPSRGRILAVFRESKTMQQLLQEAAQQ